MIKICWYNKQDHDYVQVCHDEMTLAETQHSFQDTSTMSNVPTRMWTQGRFTEQANGPTGKDITLMGDLFQKTLRLIQPQEM